MAAMLSSMYFLGSAFAQCWSVKSTALQTPQQPAPGAIMLPKRSRPNFSTPSCKERDSSPLSPGLVQADIGMR